MELETINNGFIRSEKTDRFTVTVCEISGNPDYILHDWNDLNQHLKDSGSSLVLLPDLAFFEWTGVELFNDEAALNVCMENQDKWTSKINMLNVDYTIYSVLTIEHNSYFKVSYLFNRQSGHQIIRKIEMKKKSHLIFLPKEPMSRNDCVLMELKGYRVGIALDTELWISDFAGHMAKSGIDLLICPRASSKASVEQWIRQGQAMAVLSGAFCLSSNKARSNNEDFHWGGRGFIAEPFTGNLLGSTNNHKRFVTMELDMNKSRIAKSKFPLKNLTPNF